MIVSVMEWDCLRCQKVHRRQIAAPDAGSVLKVFTKVGPRIPLSPVESLPPSEGYVTYQIVAPADLTCWAADLDKPDWA